MCTSLVFPRMRNVKTVPSRMSECSLVNLKVFMPQRSYQQCSHRLDHRPRREARRAPERQVEVVLLTSLAGICRICLPHAHSYLHVGKFSLPQRAACELLSKEACKGPNHLYVVKLLPTAPGIRQGNTKTQQGLVAMMPSSHRQGSTD